MVLQLTIHALSHLSKMIEDGKNSETTEKLHPSSRVKHNHSVRQVIRDKTSH